MNSSISAQRSATLRRSQPEIRIGRADADLRPLEPFPQVPQSRYPAAADPGPVNPEDNRRVSVYPQVEIEPTANVCPSGPQAD